MKVNVGQNQCNRVTREIENDNKVQEMKGIINRKLPINYKFPNIKS